jgi:ATP-dependent DNA helicase 2 subunit 2
VKHHIFIIHANPFDKAIDALIVGIETQHDYLSSKKTWTRKIVLITDGENPIEIEDWEATVKKMDVLDIGLTVMCVFINAS